MMSQKRRTKKGNDSKKKKIFDLDLVVLHSLKAVNDNRGTDQKPLERYIKDNYDVELDKEDFSKAVHKVLKKGLKLDVIHEREKHVYHLRHSVVLPPLPTKSGEEKVDLESLIPNHSKKAEITSGAKTSGAKTSGAKTSGSKSKKKSKCPNPKPSRVKKAKFKMDSSASDDSSDEDDDDDSESEDD